MTVNIIIFYLGTHIHIFIDIPYTKKMIKKKVSLEGMYFFTMLITYTANQFKSSSM